MASNCTNISFTNRRANEITDDFRGSEKSLTPLSAQYVTPMRPLSSEVGTRCMQNRETDFVRPPATVLKCATHSTKLKTFRSNKYTPKRRKIALRFSGCSSSEKSVMSEFDARLVNSAISETQDLSSDQASSIWTNDNITVAETEGE